MAEKRAILLYDGYCNLCGAVVRFVKRHDRRGRITLLPLQSERGKELLKDIDFESAELSTVVLLIDSQRFVRSDAVLRVFRLLGGGWALLYGFTVVPRFLRDAIYRLVAGTRYRLFGRSDTCHLP